ncbi:MAG: LysM peptidoglycan-binding domain-containing protein [Betaproteobacteria bacterium]|nr:LysM peptidoglycan-binding domain-containing protein [Betaproteobacteria bacterium]
MRKSNIFAVLAFLLASPYAWAQGNIKLTDNPPDQYVVQKGDTLWGIAGKFLKEPWRWGEIWRLNKDQIRNPHRIYPGDVIVLDRSGTTPQLALAPTVKLSPQVRAEPLDSEAVPAIPASAIEPFLTQPLVIEQGGLENAPRIVATEENRVHLGPGAKAYVSGLGQSTQTNWQIFRPGRALIDPDSNQTLGFEAIYLGSGRIIRQGEPATMQIVTTTQEIGTGDRIVPAGAPVINQYVPRAPTTLIKGRIISLYNGLATSEGGKFSIISLNRGRRNGMEMGHVLAVLRTGALIPDPQSTLSRDSAPMIRLPDERYGLVFVFRTFDAVSYALVMDSSRPIAPGDVVQTP